MDKDILQKVLISPEAGPQAQEVLQPRNVEEVAAEAKGVKTQPGMLSRVVLGTSSREKKK